MGLRSVDPLWYHRRVMDSDLQPCDPARADRMAFFLLKAVNRAIREHRLLGDGERVMVAVSGGKDSLTLLDLLYRRQRTARDKTALAAGLVRSDYHCGRAAPEEWLARWCAAREIPFAAADISVLAELHVAGTNACFRCSRLRRKALLGLAQDLGCQTVALGHHADDLAETVLMNLVYSATFQGMEMRREYFGLMTVIRPLAYVEERDIAAFARASGYPIRGEPCPAGAAGKRSVARGLLRQAESHCHGARRNILAALARANLAPAGASADVEEARENARRGEEQA
ncbi:MAG: tRNA 2-thiocytidine biosynthesis protein TtcA [Chloroflexi bacterium]|nr:tRNA 2-thiocytidine biosynthesis protein TtcA [Chloroflexota bacterium]